MAASVSPTEIDKSKKYDRQLRLWGENGQSALESSQVCLINATPTGTEILKSIVLPGIGAFTIVDGNKVTGEDAGINFFTEKTSIGKSRAEVATRLLLELNGDVRGDFVDEPPEKIIENNPAFFTKFNMVIATGLAEKTLLELANHLWCASVPLIVCRTYGMIGYIRLQVAEHTIIESHPDNTHDDLRLDQPFPEILKHVESYDLESMDKKDHSHTPYVILLLKYLHEWKKLHGDGFPSLYKEKQEFKQLIKSGIRIDDKGNPEEEENFEEALKAVNTAFNVTKVPSHVEDIFNDDICNNLTSDSKPFWFMAQGLKDFVENEGKGSLPVRGVIPDMTSDSERYIALQNVYRAKANADSEAVFKCIQNHLRRVGKHEDFITFEDTKLFCKNAFFVRAVRGRSLAEEYSAKSVKIQDIMMHLDNPDSEIVFYVLLRAVDRFFAEYGRYPGYYNDEVEPDIVKLKSCLCKILQEWGCGPLAKDDYVHEMCRYGAAELHSVAAFVGGCAAQEVIKIITGQYVPLDNTFLYNAMTATSATFQL